jgi:microcystin-dependent protein
MPSHTHDFYNDLRQFTTKFDGECKTLTYIDRLRECSALTLINENMKRSLSTIGESIPHNNMPPYMSLTYIIKL